MKILIVSQYFWPERFKINDIALALKESGNEVTVLTGIPNYPEGKFYKKYGLLGPYFENYEGVNVIRVPHFPRGDKKGILLALNYLSFMIVASILGPLLLIGRKFDSIFIYQLSPVTAAFPAIVLKLFKRAKVYFWVTDLWPESLVAAGIVKESSKKTLGLVAKFVKFMFNYSDKILVTSKGFIENIENRGISKDKIIYWPQWGERLFYETEIKEELLPRDEVPEGFVVMFAGNMGTSQSFETVVAAAQKLKEYKDIKWVIIGDGLIRSWVEEEIVKRGLEDCFFLLGSKPMEMMPYYHELSSALLVSLKKNPIFSITLPTKVQSCLASGKPLLISMDGDAAELVNSNKCGATAPASDVEALVEATLTLYNTSENERAEMGKRGKEYFYNNFERQLLLGKLETILRG